MEIERLLRESQREVLRLQRQLSVTSSRQSHDHSPDRGGSEKCAEIRKEEGVEKVKSAPQYNSTLTHLSKVIKGPK